MTTVNEIGAHKMFVVISFLIAVNLFIEAVSELSYGLVSKLFWRVHPIKIKNKKKQHDRVRMYVIDFGQPINVLPNVAIVNLKLHPMLGLMEF